MAGKIHINYENSNNTIDVLPSEEDSFFHTATEAGLLDKEVLDEVMSQRPVVREKHLAREAASVKPDEGLHVLLLPETGDLQYMWIPPGSEGKFDFENDHDSQFSDKLYVRGNKNEYQFCCVKPAYLIDDKGNPNHIGSIYSSCLYEVRNVGQRCCLYAEAADRKVQAFHNFQIYTHSEIGIGSADYENDVVYANHFISPKHSVIYRKDNILHIRNLDSNTGTWVNNKRITDTALKAGDRVSILGLTIIIGVGFIAVNSDHPWIRINEEHLGKMTQTMDAILQNPIGNLQNDNRLFNRQPRRIEALDPHTIRIESPPMSLNGNSIPMLLRMGSPLVMGGASALSGNYLMLLSMVLFPFLTQKYTDKEKKEYEERRIVKYKEYLDGKREEIENEKQYEERVLKTNYPDLDTILQYPVSGKQLWERRTSDDDFLKMRIGYGSVPLHAKIEYPEERFNMDEDELEQEMIELATAPAMLEDVPILVDFTDNFVCAVSGCRDNARAFAKRIIMSMAVLNSYDELKMIILAEPEDIESGLEFTKYIPHTWDDQKSIRYIATSPGEAYQIGERLQSELDEDVEKPRSLKEILRDRPYYVVFAMSKRVFDSMEVLKTVMQAEKTCGVTVITLFEDMPKDCSLLFNIDDSGNNTIAYLREISRDDDYFALDDYDEYLADAGMKRVANLSLKNITQAYSLPKSLSFLEMFKAGRIEHLNVLKRWEENTPTKSLAAPIGVATDGSTFYLDLHQKYQGPHGLVAGTTGSGKSEFLITYILSMAINYRPEEVAFVLIDYKGGGLAGAFDDPVKGIRLPHLVGTITNLDGAAISRSLVSIESELKRRQRVFNEAKSISDEGTMDIYSYQKLYRNHIVSEPMPHLFIISDEFAELKQQQPEFMEKLISAARIGRSLGVHLILATQKPAGVVNDQILSNTKFRVCLKVQDKMDSMDMLKRPEAAELKDTGRFYLQVGYNEFFALGQSGWSGAPYEPQDEVIVQRDDSIRIIDYLGQTVSEIKPAVKKVSASGTQLVSIVKALTKIAEREGISIRQLWKPALEKRIDLKALSGKDSTVREVGLSLGLLDDPENQEQFELYYNFENSQHLMIAGLASTGKTQLIQSMIYSIAESFTPDEVNFFIFDYSSRLLRNFKGLPHCSAVLLEEDSDKIEVCFDMISRIVAERKQLFSDIGADSFATAKKLTSIPLILVFIDNIAGLSTTRVGEQMTMKLPGLLKEGLNYGIKYIVSCTHLSDMNMRLRQEFGDRICLNMKDKYEYIDALNCKVSYIPPDYPGRGLYNYEGRPLEFQAAIFHADSDGVKRITEMADAAHELQDKYKGSRKAARIPVVDDTISYEEFSDQFSPGRIPLGFSHSTRKSVALPLKQTTLLSVYQGNTDGTIPLMDNFLLIANKERMNVWAITKNNDSYLRNCDFSKDGFGNDCRLIESENGVLQEYWHTIVDELVRRRDLRKNYCLERGIDPEGSNIAEQCFGYMSRETEPLLLFIESFADFCLALDGISEMVYDKIFQSVAGLNVYVIAFFHPNDPDEAKAKLNYSGFNANGNALLFGGLYEKQSLVHVDAKTKPGQLLPYNHCLMQYRSQQHEFTMPCGEIAGDEEEQDETNIFN